MATIAIEHVFNIIQFLPFGTQAHICEKTRSAVLPLMANVIKRSMKNNRERIMKQMEDETDSIQLMRSAQCLYQGLNENQLREVIQMVIQNSKKYPQESIHIIKMGFEMKWSMKKIYRHMISKFDVEHLVDIGW